MALSRKIELGDSPIGENYFKIEKTGPYIRFSNSQDNHIEDGLKFWLQRTAPEEIEKVSKETADQGSLLHRYFSEVLQEKKEGPFVTATETDAWAEPVIGHFRAFRDRSHVVPLLIEKAMVSDSLGLGGTVDFYGTATIKEHGSGYWLLDWKTGGLYDSYKCQLAVYRFMLHESGLMPDFGRCNLGICQFHRDGKTLGFLYVEDWVRYLRAALLTFERWKIDNTDKLKWLLAPDEVLAERKKTRGKRRKDFDADWKPEWAWPWLQVDSLEVAGKIIKGE